MIKVGKLTETTLRWLVLDFIESEKRSESWLIQEEVMMILGDSHTFETHSDCPSSRVSTNTQAHRIE